jgi:hypothetical protein
MKTRIPQHTSTEQYTSVYITNNMSDIQILSTRNMSYLTFNIIFSRVF